MTLILSPHRRSVPEFVEAQLLNGPGLPVFGSAGLVDSDEPRPYRFECRDRRRRFAGVLRDRRSPRCAVRRELQGVAHRTCCSYGGATAPPRAACAPAAPSSPPLSP